MKNILYTIFFLGLAAGCTTLLTFWYLERGLTTWVAILAALGTAVGGWIALVLAILIPMTVVVLVMNKYDDWYFRRGFHRWLEKHGYNR